MINLSILKEVNVVNGNINSYTVIFISKEIVITSRIM